MATLTIKPTAAGNDVQIKSGDGNTTHATFGDTNNISMSTGSIASAVIFPNGHILQVQTASKTNLSTTTATSPTSTGLTVSITPSNATNKVYVQAIVGSVGHSGALNRMFISISGATSQSVGDDITGHDVGACWCPRSDDAGWSQGSLACAFLDAPASTSAQTYTLNYWQSTSGTCSINSSYNNDANSGNAITTLTAWEVVA